MNGTFSESYEVVSELERVVEFNDGRASLVTHVKIKKSRSGEFYPVWEHTVNNYSDTHDYPTLAAAVSYWEQKLESIVAADQVKNNPSYF